MSKYVLYITKKKKRIYIYNVYTYIYKLIQRKSGGRNVKGAVGPLFHLPVYLRDLANQRQLKVFSFCSMYNTGLNNQNFNIILT
jgi:hypothetical protein